MEAEEKGRILKAERYVYNFERLAYYNRARKKVFTVEWVDDHNPSELRQALDEPNDSEGWKVYSDPLPSQRVINEFLAEIHG